MTTATQRYFEVYCVGNSFTVVGEDRAQQMVAQLYHSGRERPDYFEISAAEFRRRAIATMKAAGVK